MVTPHLPWKFHANLSSRFLVMLLTKKLASRHRETKKDTKKSLDYNTPSPYRGRGNKLSMWRPHVNPVFDAKPIAVVWMKRSVGRYRRTVPLAAFGEVSTCTGYDWRLMSVEDVQQTEVGKIPTFEYFKYWNTITGGRIIKIPKY